MTRRLTGLILTALLMAVALPAQAQQRAPRMMDRITQDLDLTERQQNRITDAIEEAEPGTSLWTLAATLQDVLTSEQKEQLLERGKIAQAYQRGVRDGNQRGGDRRGVRDGNRRRGAQDRALTPERQSRRMRGDGGQPHRVLSGIPDLTDEQKAALIEIGDAQRDAMQSLREEARDESGREALRERMQELSEGSRERVAEILTDEQIGWLEKNRGPRAGVVDGTARRPGMRGTRGASQRGNRALGMRQGRTSKAGEHMAEVLDLTDDQVETMAIHRALAAGMSAGRTRAGMGSRFGR